MLIDRSSFVGGQVGLGQGDGVDGEALAQLLGLRRERVVRADPGDEQQAPQDHEGVELGLVGLGHRSHLAVALEPRRAEFGDARVLLEERDRGREVVHEPAEAAIVEVDHADVVAVLEQVGEALIRMAEAEPLGPGPVGGEPPLDRVDGALEERERVALDADAVLPAAPVAVGAERVLEGVMDKCKGMIHGVTCGAGMPYRLAEIAAHYGIHYYPIISSGRAFRALWKRSYEKTKEWLGAVVYEDPWLAGGHNGLSNGEDPTRPEDPYPRVLAHRGGGGLAPENTLAAIRAAADLGVDRVEIRPKRSIMVSLPL